MISMIEQVHRRMRGGGATRPLSLVAVIAVAIAAGSLAGCGAGDASPPTAPAVASVQGKPISRAALTHWMHVQSARHYGLAAPFPDPPRYSHCVAAGNALRARSSKAPLAPQDLRRRCANVYAQLKDKALAFLITAKWIEGEAAARGVRVSPADAEATYTQLLNGPTGSTFAANRRRADMSKADELLQLRLEELSRGLSSKFAGPNGTVSPTKVAAYRRRWKQRTTCQAEYVMHDCRNYVAATGP
jgi:hypothetical protein